MDGSKKARKTSQVQENRIKRMKESERGDLVDLF